MRCRGSIHAYLAAAVLTSMSAAPAIAVAQTRTFSVPAAPAQIGIGIFAGQADTQVLISEDDARGITTRAVSGDLTVDQALTALLDGTPLDWRKTAPNSYSIVDREYVEAGALPDIIVQGTRNWTLNTGIRRSADDSQPFVVIDGEAIRRSGAPDLETFLRNQLSVNASPGTSDQADSGSRNTSSINLRGLGARETLILVDGRRLAGTTSSDGSLGQTSIVGIPLAGIERIEVLASSASGIYGNGATGGVINIILRRDYRGAEVSTTYSNTFKGGRAGKRFDATGGLSLEDGRTNITFTGNWTQTDPLFYRDREDLVLASRRQGLANNPDFYRFAAPLGTTPNIRSLDFSPLQLDPIYGGATLGSFRTFVPAGFRGVATDGVAPLVAGIDGYSLGLAENAAPGGGDREMLYGIDQMAASIAGRREFTSWLRVYAEAAWTRSESLARTNSVPLNINLAADAPNNPFTQDIQVTVPFIGANYESNKSIAETYRGVLGAIVKLPGDWQAVLDFSRGRNKTSSDPSPANIDQSSLIQFQNGSQDILRDVRLPPAFNYVYQPVPYSYNNGQTRNDITTTSLQLAGPVPVSLPGGKPTVTLRLERTSQDQAANYAAQNTQNFSVVNYSPRGHQQVDAVYGEINLPIFGEGRTLPLIEELLLTVSARYERYSETGSPAFQCFVTEGPLPSLNLPSLCTAPIVEATTEQSSINPSYSVRWRPVAGVTLRASYATGYLTPKLTDLVKVPQERLYTTALDSLRGNEVIGIEDIDFPGNFYVPGFRGGNTDVKPETSKTLTAGAIFTPAFVPGLRVSVDWTRITKRDNYFDPSQLLFPGFTPGGQAAFDSFLTRYPDRVTRAAPSDGFAVGRITSIDASIANLVGSESESIDFVASYTRSLFGGDLNFDASATYVSKLELQEVPQGPTIDYAGVISDDFLGLRAGFGTMKWKGAARVQWTGEKISLAWQARYFDSYFVNADRSVSLNQGSATIGSQIYHDLSGSYIFGHGVTLRAGVNNVFNMRPPVDSVFASRIYSTFGDPRLANYYLTLVKSF